MVIYTFHGGICPKVNVTARVEFELIYFHSSMARDIGVQSQVESYQKLKRKIVFDISLLNTQVRIKGNVERSRE